MSLEISPSDSQQSTFAANVDTWISELEAALQHVAKVRHGMRDAKYHGAFKVSRAFDRLKEAAHNVERERSRSEIE